MKKILGLAAAFIITTSFNTTSDDVFICNSETSVAYHANKTCRGLNKCTHQVITVTKTDATGKYKKRACKICY